MNPFKKKKGSMEAKLPQQTFQELQQQITKALVDLGHMYYTKNARLNELQKLNNDINDKLKEIADLDNKAQATHTRL
jgi:hypothetical protein